MKTSIKSNGNAVQLAASLLLMVPILSSAQVPVDENGNAIGEYQSQSDVMAVGNDGIPKLSNLELQELVGPIALYPDDLLAIVLPASAYPLQVAAAARFVEALESDPSLQPDPEWDDSIVALVNYPEVIKLLDEDLDWTYRLGEAVISQQTDVVAAVEAFRDRAYAAGNLKSDSYQTVSNDQGVIEISPVAEDVIYVPYYEPQRVVVYQSRPAYYYYPRPYPVYYYPYAANHYFDRGYFWGVTTAFTIGWRSDSLHVYHQSYRGHPYYGRSYRDNWWYRRPSINVYNTTYINNRTATVNRYSNGDRWHPRENRREYVREGYARDGVRRSRGNTGITQTSRRNSVARTPATATIRQSQRQPTQREREPAAPIRFRDRGERPVAQSRDTARQVDRSRDTLTRGTSTRGTSTSGSSTTRREAPTATRQQARQSRPAPTPKIQPQATVRQEPVRQARQQTTRRQEPVRQTRQQTTRQEPTRQVRQQAATQSRSQPQSRAPSRSQSQSRAPSQSQPQTRSQPTRSAQPTRSSDDSRSRDTKRRR